MKRREGAMDETQGGNEGMKHKGGMKGARGAMDETQ